MRGCNILALVPVRMLTDMEKIFHLVVHFEYKVEVVVLHLDKSPPNGSVQKTTGQKNCYK